MSGNLLYHCPMCGKAQTKGVLVTQNRDRIWIDIDCQDCKKYSILTLLPHQQVQVKAE